MNQDGRSQPPAGEEDYQPIGLVHVTLRAELGRTTARYRDAVEWGPGTVVTLDRLAGESVELRCRGQCIAKGEVVVQDDAFAIRVTEIVHRRAMQANPLLRRQRHRRK